MSTRTILENPETGINIVCLAISALAPALAIGPVVGLPTGAAIALGLIAVIKNQRHASDAVRKQYFLGAWFIRIFAGCFEQMAYFDQFDQRPTLPFALDATAWAWIATVFMAAIDLWAYRATAARAAAKTEALNQAAADAKNHQYHQEEERAETERKRAEVEAQIQLAKIHAEADTRKATEIAKAEAEARKYEAEMAAEARKIEAEEARKREEAKAETARKQAEERRKRAELEAETERNRTESRRKEQEENRKRAEERRKQAEAQKRDLERLEQEKAEAARKQAETEAEMKTRWAAADLDTRKALIPEAERKLFHFLGRKPTQAEIAAELGTTDRTLRNYSKAA